MLYMRDDLYTLVIDDNPDDRALVIRELRRAFPNFRALEVADAKGLAAVLESGAADLVITDFQLHWTNGLNVLRSVKARWPDCPVVMFTGTGSEEIAVEAMKSGLDDYVLKSPQHFVRLHSAAKAALKVARQKRQLKLAEARYSGLFTTVPIGLFRATPEGKLLDANPALVEMLHYPDKGSLLMVKMRDLFLDPEDYRRWLACMAEHGVVRKFEARLRTFEGESCWVENSARALRTSGGGLSLFEGSIENINERKLAEDERERLILELQDALAKVKTLSGLLPICAECKKIRDDNGYWNQIEEFIQNHSDAEFTHSFCPECMKNLYPELFESGAKILEP
jgi:PAS domain S-box-containing protein